MTRIARFFMPRIEYILFAAILWGIASTGPILLNSDGDLPRHLLVGKIIRESGVSLTDIFSYRTVGFPSFPHEWLSQVLLSSIYDLLGLGGVVLLTALTVTLTWVIIYYAAIRKSESLFVSVVMTGLGVGASLIHILPRPHLFTFLFIALWIIALEQIEAGKTQRWWQLPVLMLVWVNLHGMFILGIAIWLIYIAGSFFENSPKGWLKTNRTIALLSGGTFSIFATFLSPSGLKIWGTIISLGGNAYITSHIPEYQSANFHMPETWPFILLLLLLIASFSRSTQKVSFTDIFMVSAFAALALYSSRMLPIFAVVSAPIAAQKVSNWLKQDFSGSRFFIIEKNINTINGSSGGLIWLLVAFLTIGFLFRSNIPIDAGNKGNIFDPKFFPVDAVTWLEDHPQTGHMFNEFDWGGYILLKLWPQYQIFMDGHTHIYGEALTREYEQVITLEDSWQDIFAKYNIQWSIVRSDSRLANALAEKGWTTLYKDNTAIILHAP